MSAMTSRVVALKTYKFKKTNKKYEHCNTTHMFSGTGGLFQAISLDKELIYEKTIKRTKGLTRN